MDEQEALAIIDQELDEALSNIVASPGLRSSILRRTRVSRLPEILNCIGGAAVLAILCILLISLSPDLTDNRWLTAFVLLISTPALYSGIRSLRELAE